MGEFMGGDVLLTTETARTLFHEVAKGLPIVDYHCHISPREIADDIRFDNIAQAWLGGDHYKWRLMRAAGVDERLITGDAPDRERFQAFCETMELAIGNPVHQWSHLELQRYFGCDLPICADNAQEIWEMTREALSRPEMSVRGLIRQANVHLLCTTDDPADDLHWHAQIAADPSFGTVVLPAWRPDAAMAIDRAGFAPYMDRLGEAAGVRIATLDDLRQALVLRLDFFETMGASVSDHGLDHLMWEPAPESYVEEVFERALAGHAATREEKYRYLTWLIGFLAGEYTRRDWVMQLHFGAQRNVNLAGFAALGADVGYDCVNTHTPSEGVTALLAALHEAGNLPKTILYSLNPADNLALDTIAGCFQEGPTVGKIQHGSAWWFYDTLSGMRDQMSTLASQGLLGTFIGMLTDSRSFLSYPRHEYFRRVLCSLLGKWVEAGLYPADRPALERIVRGVCLENALRYFGWTDIA